MASIYDDIDLDFSWNGDYLLDGSKDLSDTSDDGLRSLINELHHIAASALLDWEVYPNFGASLDDFVGERNTRSIGDAIHDRMRLAITSAGLVLEEDLEVRVLPVHIHKVLIILKVNALPTPLNRLENGETVVVQIVFDFVEQGIFFLDKTPDLLLANSL